MFLKVFFFKWLIPILEQRFLYQLTLFCRVSKQNLQIKSLHLKTKKYIIVFPKK